MAAKIVDNYYPSQIAIAIWILMAKKRAIVMKPALTKIRHKLYMLRQRLSTKKKSIKSFFLSSLMNQKLR